MSSCAPLLCINIKHATLVNNCYPLKESSSVPLSSELSYLTFYASSRPAKLLKVGAFLEKKVKKDIRKGRSTNNKVTLNILKALIHSCHRDLNIFSKYIVRILNLLLTSDENNDIELIDLSCETFILFSGYDNGSTLGVDNEFTNDYESLLKRWSGLCQSPVLEMKYIGHRAIQAAVTSGALQASDFKVQLNIIFPPLIIALADAKTPLEVLETNHGTIDIRTSKKEDINNESVEKLATHTISLLFNKITGASVRLSLSPLLNYMDEKEKWDPPHLAIIIIKVILDALQPQYRYLLVSEILFQLDSTDNVTKHTALISILDNILNANTPLVGVSVLEVLNSLFTLLIKESSSDSSAIIIHAIGGLASQIYYDNQLNDITSYLVSKLRPNTSLDRIENMDIHDYRTNVLRCLESIISNTGESYGIPLYAWTPALSLLSDKNPSTRVAFCLTFNKFLKGIMTRGTVNPKEEFPTHTLINYQDGVFVDQFIHSLYDWIQRKDLTELDLQLFYTVVCIFNNKFGVDATTAIFPLLFKIESDLKEKKNTNTCIESILLSILFNIGRFYYIQSLQDYIKSLQELNQFKQESFVQDDSILESHLLEQQQQPAIKQWIDKSEVVGFLSKDGHLRDEKDTHGLDLESKLFAEWGSELLLKKSSKARIQITSDNQVKPRLSSPWLRSSNPQLTVSSSQNENKSDILVETLKGALSAQSTMGEEDSDSTQSTSLSSNSKPRTADMNSLLIELNIPQIQYSTASLVKPPYST